MRKIWKCRRTSICLIAIGALFVLGMSTGMDVSSAIATVAVGLAGANGVQGSFEAYRRPKRHDQPDGEWPL